MRRVLAHQVALVRYSRWATGVAVADTARGLSAQLIVGLLLLRELVINLGRHRDGVEPKVLKMRNK